MRKTNLLLLACILIAAMIIGCGGSGDTVDSIDSDEVVLGNDWRTYRSYSEDYSLSDGLTICFSLLDDESGYAVYDSSYGGRIGTIIFNRDSGDIELHEFLIEDYDGNGELDIGVKLNGGGADWYTYDTENAVSWPDNVTGGFSLIDMPADVSETPLYYEYQDDMLYGSFQSFPALSDEMYTEDDLTARMKTLEGDDIRIDTLELSEEYSMMLTYPAWLVIYETGQNEDTARCVDIYYQTDTNEFRIHTTVPIDYAQEYEERTNAMLERIIAE